MHGHRNVRLYPMVRLGLMVTLALALVAACVSKDPGAPVPLTCESYCAEIAKTCDGDKAQYRDKTECLKACGMLDLGNATDGETNSIGCRLRHAQTAKTREDCAVAGPFGGGICGPRCSSFCRIVSTNCGTQTQPPFGGSEANCNEECPKFTFDPSELESITHAFEGGNTLSCREFHLILALNDPANHCPHADVVSSTCQ